MKNLIKLGILSLYVWPVTLLAVTTISENGLSQMTIIEQLLKALLPLLFWGSAIYFVWGIVDLIISVINKNKDKKKGIKKIIISTIVFIILVFIWMSIKIILG